MQGDIPSQVSPSESASSRRKHGKRFEQSDTERERENGDEVCERGFHRWSWTGETVLCEGHCHPLLGASVSLFSPPLQLPQLRAGRADHLSPPQLISGSFCICTHPECQALHLVVQTHQYVKKNQEPLIYIYLTCPPCHPLQLSPLGSQPYVLSPPWLTQSLRPPCSPHPVPAPGTHTMCLRDTTPQPLSPPLSQSRVGKPHRPRQWPVPGRGWTCTTGLSPARRPQGPVMGTAMQKQTTELDLAVSAEPAEASGCFCPSIGPSS